MLNQNHHGVCLTQHVVYSKAQLQTPVIKRSWFSGSAGNVKFRNKNISNTKPLDHNARCTIPPLQRWRRPSSPPSCSYPAQSTWCRSPWRPWWTRSWAAPDSLLRITDSKKFSDLRSFSLISHGTKLSTHPGLPCLLVDQRARHLVQKLHWVLRLQRRMWDKKCKQRNKIFRNFQTKNKTSCSQTEEFLNGKHQGPVAPVG